MSKKEPAYRTGRLSPKQREELLKTLQARFARNMKRHKDIDWDTVEEKLEANTTKLWSLFQMEETGGEPDVVVINSKKGEYTFYDCSPESPNRRSLCYDREALDKRKENKPKNTVVDVALEMGIELLTEEEYLDLQKLGDFDLKTSSWISTPTTVRKLWGALYCDRRYDRVFIGHNGADSYYAARGFRGSLRV